MRHAAVTLWLLLTAALSSWPQSLPAQQTAAWTIAATPWPEADALFHQDPRWLGGDDAYSVDLGNGRVLWLFGDSFIATSAKRVRRESKMVRNSVAIQHGYDPATAKMEFFWRGRAQTPASFFAEPKSFFAEKDGLWHWPGHGIRLGGKLLLFLMRLQKVNTGLGFDSAGWTAVLVENPDASPAQWRIRWLKTPPNPYRVVIGSASVLRLGEYVYAYSTQEAAGHNVFLIRWPVAQASRGDLSAPEWWTGAATGWRQQAQLTELPPPVFTNGQTEFTVHLAPALNRFVQIQGNGFGPVDLALRQAEQPTGPWSPLQPFFKPAEAARPGVFLYAAKAHPQLQGAEVVLTYVINHSDFGQLVNDSSIYYPRFLKGRFQPTN